MSHIEIGLFEPENMDACFTAFDKDGWVKLSSKTSLAPYTILIIIIVYLIV